MATRNKTWKEGGEMNQEVERRREGQRLRPSSKASREAAASRTKSDASQPPFGTTKGGKGGDCELCGQVKKQTLTHKPNDLVVFDL